MTLDIEGMSCDECVKHVTNALLGLDGVATARVNLAAHHAVVTYDPVKATLAEMIAAIEEEGYEAVEDSQH